MSDLRADLRAQLGDRYRIERELGGGGMSRVFVAEELALGRRVVLKVLPPDMAATVNTDRFRREVQFVARLQHPHIVPVLATGEDAGTLWYSMPYVDGDTLRGRMSAGTMSVREVITVWRNMLDALSYAHTAGVMHRDIKPDNVLLRGRHAVVTDDKKDAGDMSAGHSVTALFEVVPTGRGGHDQPACTGFAAIPGASHRRTTHERGEERTDACPHARKDARRKHD